MKVNNKKHGFTLIEMLIVIVIILILSGMVLKIMTLVSRKTGVTRCSHDLLQMENALAEYYSEYGQYPPGIGDPAENAEYEYGNSRLQPENFRGAFLSQHSFSNGIAGFFPDISLRDIYNDRPNYLKDVPPEHKEWGLGYRYGLYSHLWLRKKGAYQKHWYQADTERDINVKNKWSHFLKDLHIDDDGSTWKARTFKNYNYTNNCAIIMDSWWRGYRYECKPPFYSYKLWSVGPDGRDGTKDDIHAGSN